MLTTLYFVNFLGMMLLPVVTWIIFTRRFSLSWKLVLAGGLTFIASQIPHVPLTLSLNPYLSSTSLLVAAIILGLLAGIFEETAPTSSSNIFSRTRAPGRKGCWSD